MGIKDELKKKALESVGDKLVDVAAFEYFDKVRSVHAVEERSTTSHRLYICKIRNKAVKRGFYVTDEDGQRIYWVKPDRVSFGPAIRLFDLEKKELGSVHSNTSLAQEKSCSIYVNKRAVGTVSRSLSFKVGIDINVNGWRADGNLLGYRFTIYDRDDEPIMRINDTTGSGNTYVVELDNMAFARIGILLAMAIEIIFHQ